jgi:hypothetical protein
MNAVVKSIVAGRYGREPVATTITSAVSRVATPFVVTSTVCGSTIRAVPCASGTPCRARSARMRRTSRSRTASLHESSFGIACVRSTWTAMP